MRTVERLLVAGSVELRELDPGDPTAQFCLASYYAELNRRSEKGFDPAAGISAEPHEMTEPNGCFLVAFLHGDPVGCGGVKYHPGEPCEIKRMWVAESARGAGLGRRLLEELERRAVGSGARIAHIETSEVLGEAMSLYRKTGYVEVAAFNDEPFADHWFEKRLCALSAAA
jgi:GNAT superfamily N-acetyltransferase